MKRVPTSLDFIHPVPLWRGIQCDHLMWHPNKRESPIHLYLGSTLNHVCVALLSFFLSVKSNASPKKVSSLVGIWLTGGSQLLNWLWPYYVHSDGAKKPRRVLVCVTNSVSDELLLLVYNAGQMQRSLFPELRLIKAEDRPFNRRADQVTNNFQTNRIQSSEQRVGWTPAAGCICANKSENCQSK